MKLHQMYQNILNLDINTIAIKVEKESVVRSAAISAVSKNDNAPKEKSNSMRLSAEEKAVLKALGLTQKDLKSLMSGGGNE